MPETDTLHLGYAWNQETGRVGKPVTFDLSSHFTMIGPTRCGKGATLEIPNLLRHLNAMSLIDIDPSGQNASVCAQALRDAGYEVWPLNPMGLHVGRYPDLVSRGCNVLVAGVDPASPRFYEEAAGIADALEWSDKGDPFWPNAGRDYATCLIMHVRLRDGDDASLSTVLQLMMEGEETDENGEPFKGPRYTAAEMVATGHFQIAALAGRFLSNASPKTIDGIRQTAQTAARSLLSDPIRNDLARNGIDWSQLTERRIAVPVILPAEDTGFHAAWLRLIVSCALNVIYRKAGDVRVTTLLRLSEFFALGPLRSVQAAMGQAAKYGVRVWPVLQDIGQLETMFGEHGAQTFIANSGCVFAFTPGDDTTARFLSRYAGDHAVAHIGASADHGGGPARISIDVRDEPIWPAHKIRSIPKFHGLVWKFGSSVPQPVVCRPYFEDEECLHLARPDPYPHPPAPTRKLRRGIIRRMSALCAASALFGALLLVPSDASGPNPELAIRPIEHPLAAAPPVLHPRPRPPAMPARHGAPAR